MTGKKLLLAFFKSHQRQSLQVLTLDILANCTVLLLPLVIAQTYALLFDFQSARGRLLEKAGLPWGHSFWQWIAILSGLILLKALLDLWRIRKRGELSESFLYQIRQRLFLHQLRMDIRQYEERGSGRYLLRFSGDLSSVQRYLMKGILQFAADIALIIMGLLLVLWLDWRLSSIVILSLAALSLIVRMLNRRIGVLEMQRRDQKSALLAFINLRLLNVASLKAFNRETPERQRFDKRAMKIKKLGFRYHRQAAWLETVIPLVLYGMLAMVFLCIYHWKQIGYIFDFDSVFAIVLLLVSWRSTFNRLLRIGLVWKKGNISLQKVARLLQQPIEPNLQKSEVSLTDEPLHATNLRLIFGEKILFDQLNFTLRSGETGFVEGETGAGKSALVKLLAGLYRPDAGALRFGDYDFSTVHPKSLRRQIAFVSNALPLYGRTVGEAIAYSPRHRQRAQRVFEQWQQLFPALQMIDFQTPLRESGRLSASQLQLIQWLRALLTKKPFLILDEPFRDLDKATAAMLWQQIPMQTAVLLLCANERASEVIDIQVDWQISLANFKKNCNRRQ
ncbi:MAG TPA: ABC transporter ATP-binding protein [Saprospiraceae bacterium]|nr:ABC transporter ATP-binding protein [Saprospiraceae bacterium]HMP15143.1 ABC transporter ATP-binding protein [Saprospiraceae bacterium]